MKLSEPEKINPLMNPYKRVPQTLEVIEGDKSLPVFEKNFTEYWTSIYRLLAGMLGDPSEAEDLALETFYRLFQHHPDPKPDFNTGGWLYRVATNLGLQSIRSFKRRDHYELTAYKDVLINEREGSPVEILDEKEERHKVREVLAKMDQRKSQILVLRYSGKTYKEIAQVLDLSPTSISPLLLRAEREFEKRYRIIQLEEQ
jgi:RNA polymerase sigma factor (sigma-70 family)